VAAALIGHCYTDEFRSAELLPLTGSKELRGNYGRPENKRLGAANELSQRSICFMKLRGPQALIDRLEIHPPTMACSSGRDFWRERYRKIGHLQNPRKQFRRAHSVLRKPTDVRQAKTIDMPPHLAMLFETRPHSGTGR